VLDTSQDIMVLKSIKDMATQNSNQGKVVNDNRDEMVLEKIKV